VEKILLDSEGYPIKYFSILPLTLSTQLEGFRIEAFRRMDNRITMNDLRARMMPVWNQNRGEKAVPAENVFNMRAGRFRQTHRCMKWGGYGDKPFRDVLLHEMTPAMDQGNTTRDLTPLSKKEVKWLEWASNGTRSQRAGSRKLSDDDRHAKWSQTSVLKEAGFTVTEPEYEFRTINIRGITFHMTRIRNPLSEKARDLRQQQDKVESWSWEYREEDDATKGEEEGDRNDNLERELIDYGDLNGDEQKGQDEQGIADNGKADNPVSRDASSHSHLN
jgi:hypothetical protein